MDDTFSQRSLLEKDKPRRRFATVTGFAKLGAYLNQQPVRTPVRCVLPSGEEFVILPAKDYTVLTGIDTVTLPTLDTFDTVNKMEGSDKVEDKQNPFQTNSQNGNGQASALAQVLLEDEIRVDNLPL